MRYLETEPCDALRPYVRCYWELQGSSAAAEAIFPDGRPEIVFHLEKPAVRDGAVQPRSMFVGQMTGPVVVEALGNIHCFGIRFEPAGVWPLFRFSQADTLEQIVPQLLFPSAIERRILSAQSPSRRVALVEEALFRLLPAVSDPWCAAITDVLSGALPVAALRQSSGVGIRQFERLFLTRVGMTSRMFARLARFRQALSMRGPWAEIAAACGYYDQSHLIRDFQQFTGMPPGRFAPDVMSQSSNTPGRQAG